MPQYHRSNYDFVIDSSFRPFEMNELLVPFTAYKDAYEQSEAAYNELNQKADTFSYLAKVAEENPDSRAAQIYKGYADELHRQADDLARNGLNMSNRRALTSLKQRYQGEIGRLEQADRALKAEQELRRQINAKDSSILYAENNLDIDRFLDNQQPNLYNISGNELYARGATAGQKASSRIYSADDEGSTLNGYYRKWVEKNGVSPDSIAAFMNSPEIQAQVNAILSERGVIDNLRDNPQALRRARESVLNGIYDGIVYQEKVNPVRDAGVMSESERRADSRATDANARAQEEWEIRRDIMYQKNPETEKWELNPSYASDNYEINPNTGNLQRRSNNLNATTPEEKEDIAIGKALLNMQGSDLAHNGGFDISYGGTGTLPANRVHYNYIGAIANSRGKWRHGALGDDVPGHGFGIFSSSNVENAWGNFSAEGSDNVAEMRILSEDEIVRLINENPDFQKALNERLEAANVNADEADIQIVEVPNEKDSNKKGYLIAVH